MVTKFEVIHEAYKVENKIYIPLTHRLEETTKKPFLAYLVADSDNYISELQEFKDVEQISIELYTMEIEPMLEKVFENIFTKRGLSFHKTRIFDDVEGFYRTVFEIHA